VTGDRTAGAAKSEALVRPNRGRAPDAALGGRYRARDIEHDIYIVRLTSMRWQVLDVTATDVVIVDTLEGFDDRFEQARALAIEYAGEKQAYHDGLRETDPLPSPDRERRRGHGSRGRAGR
jgi:hypothetical protein